MNIGALFGETETRSITPEVVTPLPAVITPAPGQAIVRFLADPAGLKHDALGVLNHKIVPVETTEAAADLSDQIAQAQALIKNIEARRKLHVEPLKKEAKAIDEEAGRWRDPVEAWITCAKTVVLAFNRMAADQARREEDARQEAIREAARKQSEAEIMGNAEAVEAASVEIMHHEAVWVAPVVKGYKTDSGSTSTRKDWKVEVVAAELVPPAYLMPDMKKLQAAVDAGARSIDGCNVYEAETLVVRTR